MFISPAFAQTAGGESSGASMLVQMAPLVLIFVVFYFLLIRPQQKKMKEHKAKIDAVKKGDQVVPGGGLVGQVVRVDEFYADVDPIGRVAWRERVGQYVYIWGAAGSSKRIN